MTDEKPPRQGVKPALAPSGAGAVFIRLKVVVKAAMGAAEKP